MCVNRKRIFLFLHFRKTKNQKPKTISQKSQKSKVKPGKSKPIINITITIVLDLPSSLGRPPPVRDDDDGPDEGDVDIRCQEIEHRGESAGR